MRRAVYTLTAMGSLLAAGCGSGSVSVEQATSPPLPLGYLAHAPNGVLFLQWTRSGDAVTASLDASYVSASDSTKVVSDTTSFTGTISGGSVTLNVQPTSSFAATLNGTLTGSALTLSYAGSDGTLSTRYFYPSTTGAYNAAVQALQVATSQTAVAGANAQGTAMAQATAGAAATQTVASNVLVYVEICTSDNFYGHQGPCTAPLTPGTIAPDTPATLNAGGGYNSIGVGDFCVQAWEVQATGGAVQVGEWHDVLDVCGDIKCIQVNLRDFLPTDFRNGVKVLRPGDYNLKVDVGGTHRNVPLTVSP